ncbi:MAG: hypothetical protein IM542_11040 [Pseudanabaena sp. M165S2SP1A06QC]|nr:hypothetical protein [Pseudanabaena sp. M165S2SP1A06QC]
MSIHIAIYCHFNFNHVRDDRTSFSHEFKLSTRSKPHSHKPDRTLTTHKTRSPISPHQTAIAPHHLKPDHLFPKSNSDRNYCLVYAS